MLDDAAIKSVALVSLSAMVKIFLISLVGIICSKFPREAPLLPVAALKMLSRLSNLVLLPALIIVSLGSALSLAMVRRMAILILFCVLTNLVSYSIAFTLGAYIFEKKNRDLFTAASVAIGSPNAISFPLMLMQTLCEQPLVNAQYMGNSSQCMAEANSMLFVFSIGWHIMFWSYGFPMLETLSQVGSLLQGVAGSKGAPATQSMSSVVQMATMVTSLRRWAQQTLLSSSMVAIYIGLIIGLTPALQNAMFRDFTAMRPLGSALKTLSEPVVCINCLVMSANLAQIDASTLRDMLVRVRAQGQSIVSMDSSIWFAHAPRTKAACEAMVASPLHADDEGAGAAALGLEGGEAKVPPAPAARAKSGDDADHAFHALPQYRSVLSFLLCRLVLPPLVMLPVLRLAVDADLIHPAERLMQLVVCIESAAPSAQLIIVSLTQLGKPKVAAQLAFLYLCQYVASIFSITAWVSVAMSFIY